MKKTLVFLLCFSLFPAQSFRMNNGTVVVVYDGDTIKVRSETGHERRVRLIGVDTPEIGDAPSNTSLEALLAKRFTFHHLFRKRVRLTYEKELEDRYGRLLAYVWTEEGLFNEMIIGEGFARVFRRFSYGRMEQFERAQKLAQEQGRGIWHKEPYPVITTQQVQAHIGTLKKVRFFCSRIQKNGSLIFLLARKGNFAAVIPKAYFSYFGDIQEMNRKTILVFGFLEEYRGQPQIMLFFPSQIREDDPRFSMEFSENSFLNRKIEDRPCIFKFDRTRPLV